MITVSVKLIVKAKIACPEVSTPCRWDKYETDVEPAAVDAGMFAEGQGEAVVQQRADGGAGETAIYNAIPSIRAWDQLACL